MYSVSVTRAAGMNLLTVLGTSLMMLLNMLTASNMIPVASHRVTKKGHYYNGETDSTSTLSKNLSRLILPLQNKANRDPVITKFQSVIVLKTNNRIKPHVGNKINLKPNNKVNKIKK